MAEKKIDPREELSQKVEQCLTVQDIHKKVTLANDYRKRFECKNCSKWFHSNKTLFDKGRRKYTYLACPDCKWYTLLCKPDYRKRKNLLKFKNLQVLLQKIPGCTVCETTNGCPTGVT